MQHDLDHHWSHLYNQGRDFTLASSGQISKFLTFVSPTAPKTCLDIGCGTGQLTRELYHRGYAVVGVDASSSAVKLAGSFTTVSSSKLSYQQLDIEQDGLSDLPHAPYGLITCKLVYAFIKDKPALLEKVQQLLAPDGVFVVITPLSDIVPPEKKNIVASEEDMRLLATSFRQVAKYDEAGMTYLILRD